VRWFGEEDGVVRVMIYYNRPPARTDDYFAMAKL
jgi:hypothetical protein